VSVAARAFSDAVRDVRAWAHGEPRHGLAGPTCGDRAGLPAPSVESRIAETARQLRLGRITCATLAREALDRASSHAELGAFAAIDEASVLSAAVRCDDELVAGHDRGLLHGIPIGVKDNIDVAGLPTRAGSDAYNQQPTSDAAAVANLRRAGALILGKTTTHEFALGVTTPQARNPADPDRVPGGSSGGSAIAVAIGSVHAALGTDTRASVRIPAALTGVVGYKPSFDLLPTDGVLPLSWSMDHVGVLATTCADAWLVAFHAGAFRNPIIEHPDQHSAVCGLRIGVADAALIDADPAVHAAFGRSLEIAADAGANIVSLANPTAEDFDAATAAGLLISRCEAAAFHRAAGTDPAQCWTETREQLDAAHEIRASDYVDAQRLRSALRRHLADIFTTVDLLALPTALIQAPLRKDATRYLGLLARNSIPWSLVGFPAVSMPAPVEAGDLPVGLQLVAHAGKDADLLTAVVALESEVPVHAA